MIRRAATSLSLRAQDLRDRAGGRADRLARDANGRSFQDLVVATHA